MYPHTAQGVQLANSAALAGIFQISAEQTSIVCTCYGTDGAVIPYEAKIASNDITSATWSCADPALEISSVRACDVEITVNSIAVGTSYSIIIDGNTVSYTADSDDDASVILASLANGFSTLTDMTFSVSNNVLHITMTDQSRTFAIDVSNALTVEKLGSPFNFLCETKGAIAPAIGAVTTIVTQVAGWDSVSNNVPANVGREAETDIALRPRWSRSVYGRANAMTDAIAAEIYQTTGVTAVKVWENTSDVTDEYDRPPHCVEAVVKGGDPQSICNAIFKKKSAGIDTYGAISRVVYDSQGISHLIYYNEPAEVKVWLRIEITMDDAEHDEQFGGMQNIKKAILEEGEKFVVGQDVILQKFYGPIYREVTGIGYVHITASTGDAHGSYSASNITIDPRHIAVFDEARIEVAGI
jgi:uncharacterized phage protein gp47/JayE